MESKNIFLAVLLFTIQGSVLGVAGQCNEHGFICSAPDKYQLCIDGGPPEFEQTCEQGLSCHMDCAVECSKATCARCNTHGYVCINDKEFVVCNEGTDLPDMALKEECPEGYCSANCNSKSQCTPRMCPVTCTATTRLPVEGNTTAYYLCEVDEMKEVTVTTHACPPGTEYNDLKKACTTIATTTTTPATTTTTTTPAPPVPHVCTKPGRYPNTANCSKYHLCMEVEIGVHKYDYDCPATTPYFNPTTSRCTIESSVCVAPKSMVLRSPSSSGCVSDNARYEDSSSCNHYYICSWENDELVSYRHSCPEGTVFNPDTAKCTSSNNYYCDK